MSYFFSQMLSILRSAAYRPKSLVLKSFMYIDESDNDITHDHSRNPISANATASTAAPTTTTENEVVASSSRCLEASSNGNHDTGTNVLKKDLRRSGSLRISTSIKGALNLTKKAGVTSSSHLAKISESLRDKFSVGRSRPRKSSNYATECINEPPSATML